MSDVGAPGAGGAFGTEGPTAPAPAWTVPGVGTGVVRLGTSAKAPGLGATAAGIGGAGVGGAGFGGADGVRSGSLVFSGGGGAP
ncbi:MAG: hypothetical protein NT156_14500 [Mycobacterium sp.]|nr:hypothetical protein [Mycobacterium sp.]